MKGKIGLEEHFAVPETALNPRGTYSDVTWAELKGRLLELHGERLALMDRHGIEMMVVSLNAPAVQAVPDPKKAVALARQANDALADEVAKRSDRFQGLAAVAMQDPDAAIAELERAVKQLGLKGVLVNGFSQIGNDPDSAVYYDLPQYRPFWAAVERLGVPFYLHPRSPLPRDARLYAGHPWMMGAAWAFGNETAVHALRLVGSGLFDEHPKLTIVLGHLGENIPFGLWRIDHCNATATKTDGHKARRPIADYVRENFYVTTSGNFSTPALALTIAELGADRVMFSVDWPFEEIEHAATWFDAVYISESDRLKIGRTNAARLLKLPVT
jgi:predicted TIM-barrel fold metal-dependent hydrolase